MVDRYYRYTSFTYKAGNLGSHRKMGLEHALDLIFYEISRRADII